MSEATDSLKESSFWETMEAAGGAIAGTLGGLSVAVVSALKGAVDAEKKEKLAEVRRLEDCHCIQLCSDFNPWVADAIAAMSIGTEHKMTAWLSNNRLWVYHPKSNYRPWHAVEVIHNGTVERPPKITGTFCPRCGPRRRNK